MEILSFKYFILIEQQCSFLCCSYPNPVQSLCFPKKPLVQVSKLHFSSGIMPSLETFQARLHWALSNLVLLKVSMLIAKKLEQINFNSPLIVLSNPNQTILHITHHRNSKSTYLSVHQFFFPGSFDGQGLCRTWVMAIFLCNYMFL